METLHEETEGCPLEKTLQHSQALMICGSGYFFVHLTQARVIYEAGISMDGLLSSDWPVDISMRHFIFLRFIFI